MVEIDTAVCSRGGTGADAAADGGEVKRQSINTTDVVAIVVGVVVAGLFTERLLEFSVQWSVGDSVWSGLIVVGIGIATAMVMAGVFVVIPQLLAVSALVRVSSPPLVEGHGNPPPK